MDTNNIIEVNGRMFQVKRKIPETQINMEFMRNMNLYVYFSAHTGSNDIVLPWKITGEFAVPIDDWELYEKFLNLIDDVELLYIVKGKKGWDPIFPDKIVNLVEEFIKSQNIR